MAAIDKLYGSIEELPDFLAMCNDEDLKLDFLKFCGRRLEKVPYCHTIEEYKEYIITDKRGFPFANTPLCFDYFFSLYPPTNPVMKAFFDRELHCKMESLDEILTQYKSNTLAELSGFRYLCTICKERYGDTESNYYLREGILFEFVQVYDGEDLVNVYANCYMEDSIKLEKYSIIDHIIKFV